MHPVVRCSVSGYPGFSLSSWLGRQASYIGEGIQAKKGMDIFFCELLRKEGYLKRSQLFSEETIHSQLTQMQKVYL